MQLPLQARYGRPFFIEPSSSGDLGALQLRACFKVSDLIGDVFSCVGRLRRVLCACSEKGMCRQYRPSPLCIRCIYRLLASMAVLFQESSTLVCGLRCFFSFQFNVCTKRCLFVCLFVWFLNVLVNY